MVRVVIDGELMEVADGTTLLQACEMAGAEIPRFCYHERLSIAGNCRMCLVEVKGAPKPQASCALSVNDLRPGPNGEPAEILTNSATVKKAREGVMEFLLINHPLDCPICDQGGECDLQDQAMAYGMGVSRFHENKRAIADTYIGPLIKTSMTRCIKCTRCVRFSTEVGGIEELGATGRGEDVEITTYLEHAITSELQGNVIDLCPVGALTSAPYEFKARPWELTKTETICAMDAVGANIRVDSRDGEVMRILPRINEDVNEEWITDKTRFVFDGLKTQRLDRPYVRVDGTLKPASWDEALSVVAMRMKATAPEKMAALFGGLSGVEEIYAGLKLFDGLNIKNIDSRPAHACLGERGGRAGYLTNATIAGFEEMDAILLVGTNPRLEASLVNTRIRKAVIDGGCRVGLVGEACDLTYNYVHIGGSPEDLDQLGDDDFYQLLKDGDRAALVIGEGAWAHVDSAAILAKCQEIAEATGASFNILHTTAHQVGALELCALPRTDGLATAEILDGAGRGDIELLYLMGVDEIDMAKLGSAFVVYQGSHGDNGAHRADVILPGATYTEKSMTYVNTEGRVQMTRNAGFPPGEAKEDWAIIRALAGQLSVDLAFNTLDQLRARLYEELPCFANLGGVMDADMGKLGELADGAGALSDIKFGVAVEDFYLTNPIARASVIMAECSKLKHGLIKEAAE